MDKRQSEDENVALQRKRLDAVSSETKFLIVVIELVDSVGQDKEHRYCHVW